MKLAYLTNCFGSPSHTFIRRELREFERRGLHVELFGIHKDTTLAADAEDLVQRTHYAYPLPLLKLLLLNLYYSLRHPLRYWGGIIVALSGSHGGLKKRLILVYHLIICVALARHMSKAGITHLHAHFLNVSSSISLFCSRLSGIPFSVTVHSAGEKNLPSVAGLPMKLKYARHLLMISNYNIDYYDAVYPCRDKSLVIRCGMNIEDFTFRERTAPSAILNIVAVGRFVEKKGFRYLIEAAALLSKTHISCRIVILGFGPLHAELLALVSTLGVEECVSLPGRVSTDEVKSRMTEADLVVVPSVTSVSGEMEGLPVVIMEAMALGTPVIATAHSGIPEIVREDTGYLVPEKDSQALANAIAQFRYDVVLARQARKLIEEQFNIGHVVSQRLAIFEQENP